MPFYCLNLNSTLHYKLLNKKFNKKAYNLRLKVLISFNWLLHKDKINHKTYIIMASSIQSSRKSPQPISSPSSSSVS